jgi:S-adenosyl-L-methionine hydrolase (adenosine-forming)
MSARPLVLLTDYGATDFYAGVTRAVMASSSPSSRIIDLQHDIPSHDIASASFVLARSIGYLPADAVIVVVVDPGVGTERRGLVVTMDEHVLVGPDNGFLSDLLIARGADALSPVFHAIDEDAARRETGVKALGATFHGRDIFAPVAASIARGSAPASLARTIDGIRLLQGVPSVSIDNGCVRGTGRYVDHFGNVLTDIPRAVVDHLFEDASRVRVRAGRHDLGPLRNTYADGRGGELMAIVNSWGLVEATINGGRAIDYFDGVAPRSIQFELRAQ